MVMGNVRKMSLAEVSSVTDDSFDGVVVSALLNKGAPLASNPTYQGDPAGAKIISAALHPDRPQADATAENGVGSGRKVEEPKPRVRSTDHAYH